MRHLVGALVLRNLLAHHEHVAVATHFLGHGVAKCFAHRHHHQRGALRHFGGFLRRTAGQAMGRSLGRHHGSLGLLDVLRLRLVGYVCCSRLSARRN